MLRTTRKFPVDKLLVPIVKRHGQYRLLSSTGQSQGGGGKVVLTLLGTATLAAGGTIAYAKYDPSFRKSVEETIPYSDVAFGYFLDSEEPAKTEKSKPALPPLDVKQKIRDESLMKKKLERESAPQKDTEAKPAVSVPAPPPPPPVTQPHVASEAERQEAERAKQTKIAEERMKEQEMQFTAKNEAVGHSLKEAREQLERLSSEAISAQQAAINSLRKHTENLYKALDNSPDSGDAVWSEMQSAKRQKDLALKTAAEKMTQAKAAVERLKNMVREARADKITTSNASIPLAEEAVTRENYRLQKEEAELSSAQAESEAARLYEEKVDLATKRFQEELNALVPGLKLGDPDQKPTEEQMKIMIRHAHQKVQRLQKELAKQQATEQQRLEKIIEMQKQEDGKVADTRVAIELAKQQRELEEEFQKKLQAVAEEFEQELRQQLRRQTAAHSDHIQEVLHVQRQELDRQHQMDLEEKLLEDRGKYQTQLASSLSKLTGLEDALKVREEIDTADHKAKELWLACQDLKQSLKTGGLDPKGDAHLVPLGPPVETLKRMAGEKDGFVSAIVASIPEDSLQRGVYSEHALKQRFQNVSKICKRVAMIGDEGGSLMRYLLSYMQSFLIIDDRKIPAQELLGEVRVDPMTWDTFDILKRVDYCLQHENLEQALRYANQLRGEPRNVARDWIREARALLETKQAVEALMAHAASINVQAFH